MQARDEGNLIFAVLGAISAYVQRLSDLAQLAFGDEGRDRVGWSVLRANLDTKETPGTAWIWIASGACFGKSQPGSLVAIRFILPYA